MKKGESYRTLLREYARVNDEMDRLRAAQPCKFVKDQVQAARKKLQALLELLNIARTRLK